MPCCRFGLAAVAASAVAHAGCGDGTRVSLGDGTYVAAAAFGSGALVAELASVGSDDEKPTLTSDRLELYFLSTRPGGPGNADVWVSKRSSVGDPWGAPGLVAEVSSPAHERSPAVSADGTVLWLASDRVGGQGGLDIWVSVRANRSAVWSAPVVVPELNSPGDEIPRPPGQGGLVMPLASRGTPTDLYQLELAARSTLGGTWSAPSRIASVDTANIDVDGFLTDDGLLLYFSSDRITALDQDLFVASRATIASQFTVVTPLFDLNTRAADRDPWVSADGNEIYFTSNRGGSMKIYRATR
ncbi:MAG: hypothetical protein M3O50_22150 [Myxococcota bacterium]|nr:hypothetical protein [Myxococcota bacterium]